MIIIKTTPESNGAYANQRWPDNLPVPEGYIAVPSEFESVWEQYKPFVSITAEGGVIVSMDDTPTGRAEQETTAANYTLPPTESELIAELQKQNEELSAMVDMLTAAVLEG